MLCDYYGQPVGRTAQNQPGANERDEEHADAGKYLAVPRFKTQSVCNHCPSLSYCRHDVVPWVGPVIPVGRITFKAISHLIAKSFLIFYVQLFYKN